MSEMIVLPRSGVRVEVDLDDVSDYAEWNVRVPCDWTLLGSSVDRERAIELADEVAIRLRAALMPADARERVARALCCDAEEYASDPIVWAKWTRAADAVLAALKGGMK